MKEVQAIPQLRNVIKFIPFKTLTMDLEAILSDLARIYYNRNNADMVELIALADAELYPVGSFDPEAQRYEYTLKLAVPVKFYHHLKTDIDHLCQKLFRDITTITAPYVHEFISEVFLVIRIDQDSRWRDRILDDVEKKRLGGEWVSLTKEITLLHAPEDAGGIAQKMAEAFFVEGFSTVNLALDASKPKELRHVLHEIEKKDGCGIVIVSRAFIALPFTEEAKQLLTLYTTDPGKRFCQMWDAVSRADVADFSPGMARSLMYTTERMSMEQIATYILDTFTLRKPEF